MSEIKVLIQQVTGRNFVLNVHPNETVMDVKQKIQAQSDISPAHQRLLCGNEYLTEPNHTISSYGVKSESTILVVPRGSIVRGDNQFQDEL